MNEITLTLTQWNEILESQITIFIAYFFAIFVTWHITSLIMYRLFIYLGWLNKEEI